MLAVTLDDFGFETYSAPTADSALNALDTVHPDAVVLDVVLPGMDGAALVQKIRRSDEFAELPVVLISAYEEPQNHAADRFMRKPLDTFALARTIRDLCPSG
jgi:CheY-like chemotaxis protein